MELWVDQAMSWIDNTFELALLGKNVVKQKLTLQEGEDNVGDRDLMAENIRTPTYRLATNKCFIWKI